MIKQSLKFLRVLCRKHEESQNRLFGRIDVLLSIKGAEAELGELMIEVIQDFLDIGSQSEIEK